MGFDLEPGIFEQAHHSFAEERLVLSDDDAHWAIISLDVVGRPEQLHQPGRPEACLWQ